jgi:hypothetical protein
MGNLNERNARVFRNKQMPTSVILLNIKELSFWVAASAKREALCLCLEKNSVGLIGFSLHISPAEKLVSVEEKTRKHSTHA